MIAMNYSTLRGNMKSVFDSCETDAETVIVTRKNRKNVVIMSEEQYNNLMENAYLRASKANYDHILSGIEQARLGRFQTRKLFEDE